MTTHPSTTDLSSWRVELGLQLRSLFDHLGVTMRQYAKQCHMDCSVVSRYLAGTRAPHPDFVLRLLQEATEAGAVLGMGELKYLAQTVVRAHLAPAEEAESLVWELETLILAAYQQMENPGQAAANMAAEIEIRRTGQLPGESFGTMAGERVRYVAYDSLAWHATISAREPGWGPTVTTSYPGICGI
ncbi:helix-turn-helix domain-containing protein [Streptomyces sp. NPDC018711]|uniref:helix-turn-helix domain-containing protein n=1 Tax=Streptomyces sp. NPDC018711 TaxID=3365052 RepID=UPI0037A40059